MKPTEDTLEPGVVSDSGASMLTDYYDQFFSQGKISKSKLTRSQK